MLIIAFLAGIFACSAASYACTSTGCDVGAEPLQFVIFGDWGGQNKKPYTTDQQLIVANQLSTFVQSQATQFIISVGDNIYDTGVKNADDPRFETSFEQVYAGDAIGAIPWYMVAGNHDWDGNVTGQIAYSARSSRWIYPDYMYVTKFHFSNSMLAIFVHIDTILLCGNSVALKGHEAKKASKYFAWIEDALAAYANTANYLFVVGHYPVYSIASNGPNSCLIDGLQPLLIKYSASAYFNGHDHNMQHLQVAAKNGPTINYVMSGTGAYMSNSNKHAKDVPKDSSKFFYPSGKWNDYNLGGFVYAQLGPQQGTFTYYSGNGTQLYTFAMPIRNM